ncbi:molybdenum cofactor sulfurase-like isoform X2 [Xenia sp. Carnegie-2017]|uniref:molybdenum cofactor sulfurase-like isoform X2 n=1 Tax=Xenia sp. Carnegie-2017 TaxID=2897299 RepID=UPI001F044782|nr:molybdenum cofactor sulfurase-like isoform X2 [Xenia sp. Carnegie-2017]
MLKHEDGTVPFLEILAVKYGFDALANLTGSMENIAKHTFFLAQYVYKELKELKHFNDHDVCHCYCDTAFKSSSLQGPIVNFNVMKSSGSYVGYAEVSKLAATYRIHLRTGCFCNVGACQHFLNLTSAQLCKHFEAGHVCGDSLDLIDGQPTGSIRISFGYMSDLSDANNFLQFIKECFVETTSPIATQRYKNDTDEAFLKRIFIYPIKSCAAFEVKEWDLCEKGLSYDREWLIVNESGSFISQKRVPRLCYITPVIDMDEEVMRLQAPGLSEFVLPIHMSPDQTDGNVVQPRICGSKVSGIDCGDDVAKWLTTFLGQKCRLIRQNPNVFRRLNADRFCSQALSLANNSQLVMINESSCVDLLNNINSSTTAQDKTCEMSVESLVYRFRPNIIISGIGAYVEETWGSLTISDVKFECVGLCFRCRMISVNPDSGELTKEPMRTLAQIRGSKVPFGIHLQRIVTQDKAIPRLSVGNYVKFHQS